MEPVVKSQAVGTIQYIEWLMLSDRVQPSFIAGVYREETLARSPWRIYRGCRHCRQHPAWCLRRARHRTEKCQFRTEKCQFSLTECVEPDPGHTLRNVPNRIRADWAVGGAKPPHLDGAAFHSTAGVDVLRWVRAQRPCFPVTYDLALRQLGVVR